MTEATDEVLDDVTDVTEEYDTTDDSYEPTLDDYQREKSRREKAEKTLVDQKRKIKELESKSSEPTSKYLTEADLERRDFLKANPELNDYSKEIETYSKKGLSLDEAKVLVMRSDKAKDNREKLNSLGLSDGDSSSGDKSSYTKAELEKLSESQYDKVMSQVES